MTLAGALKGIPAQSVVLDAELVFPDADGAPNFECTEHEHACFIEGDLDLPAPSMGGQRLLFGAVPERSCGRGIMMMACGKPCHGEGHHRLRCRRDAGGLRAARPGELAPHPRGSWSHGVAFRPAALLGNGRARRRYRRDYLDRARPFPGVDDLVKRLKDDSYRVAVATTCKGDELKAYDRYMGVLHLFDAVACGDDTSKGNPHPDLFHEAIKKLGVADTRTLLAVGDTPYDALAAKSLGLQVAGVLTGGFSEGDLRDAGCHYVVTQVADVCRLLLKASHSRGG